MIKLTNILSEMLNTFEVQAEILSDRKESITDILDSIRAVKSITTVRNITPPEYPQREGIEYTLVIIKFVTRLDAKQNLLQIKDDILTSNGGSTDLRVPGVKSFKYKIDTIKRK
tara:strand:+ start:498 stop:839 length:342 start_codon:yes stop_codon:yes gene_type:complete